MTSQAIFESFEPESSDEEDSEVEGVDGLTDAVNRLGKGNDDEDDDSGTGVLTSQLRHFVIQASGSGHSSLRRKDLELTFQEYLPRPMLFDIAQAAGLDYPDPEGYKVCLEKSTSDRAEC